MKQLEFGVHTSQASFEPLLSWLQVHDLLPNWRKTLIVKRIIEKVGNILDFDVYSLENNFVKAMRVKIELTLNKILVPSVKIPLSTSGVGSRIV